MEVQTSGKPIDSLLEKVLCMNILSSDYFNELYRLKTYHEIIDEIYNQVDHVEPWMTGNCRGPSIAFCLLYKFFTMKLTVKQMHGLLKHADSSYIEFGVAPDVSNWTKVEFLLVAKGTYHNSRLQLTMTRKGVIWFDQVSVMPVDTYKEFAPGSNGRLTTMGVFLLLYVKSISLVHDLIARDFEVGLVYWLAKVPQLMSEFWFFGTVRIVTILKS
ncbi:hypothetical protein IFM89_013324 [Coptis chinensis]|uniref:Pre-mRNA-splicing factor 38 n=1 Tax=Coptis chinensis TaxID=261450 RepID=A0A835HEG2_9MAGN|nr:hypothetical protein IFM89_013324 [Coptis chinensis]